MSKLTETIMKSTKTSRVIISASIVISFGLMTYSWVVSPQATFIQAAERYETLSGNMEKKVLMVNNSIRVKKKKIAALTQELSFIGNSFWGPEDAVDFFGALERYAFENKCKIQSMNFVRDKKISVETKKNGKIDVVEKAASLNFIGEYGSIIGFLKTLSIYPKQVYMSEMSIQSVGDGSALLECDIDIKVYLTDDKELLTDE